MTDRPMLTREVRERCEHAKSVAIRSDLPNSYDGRQWCAACGVFWVDEEVWDPETGEDFTLSYDIDWPATTIADREQMEAAGQGRLPDEL